MAQFLVSDDQILTTTEAVGASIWPQNDRLWLDHSSPKRRKQMFSQGIYGIDIVDI